MFASLFAAGCAAEEAEEASVSQEEAAALTRFNAVASSQPHELSTLGSAAEGLVAALDSGEPDEVVDARLAELEAAVSALERGASELAQAELALSQTHYGAEPGVVRASLGPVYVAYVVGVTAFAGLMKTLSDMMSEARAARDAAWERGDDAAAVAENARIARIGAQTIEEIAKKVIPNPVDTIVSSNPVGAIVIQGASSFEDVTTLAATAACAEDPMSDDCKISGNTGATGTIPVGSIQVVVTAAGRARAVIDDVLVGEGETVTVEVDLPEIASLAPAGPEPSPGDLCPMTLDTERGQATRGPDSDCGFAVQNGADAHGLTCRACSYATAGGDEAVLQVLLGSDPLSRPCQPLGEIAPDYVYTLDDRGRYGAVSFQWVGGLTDLDQMRAVTDQLEPELSAQAPECVGNAFGLVLATTNMVPPAGMGRGDVHLRFSGNPTYPITAELPAGRCDPELDCTAISVEIAEAESTAVQGTVRSYDWVEGVACVGETTDPEGSFVELRLTDGAGVQSNLFPVRIRCF